MNTKTFAQQARNILMDGVAKKLLYWGFSPKGEVLEQPEAVSGGYIFRGDAFDDANVPHLWSSLKTAVLKKGIDVVVEEAAYTWFNRMMAIRILTKNGYDLPQLDFAEGLNNTPVILQKARQGQYGFLNEAEKARLQRIIGDYNKENEAFALLLVGYCHSHNTLNKVFRKLDDYTELLLPDNMLQDQGFLNLLNTTDAISDDEYKEVELIGWLYQFYISERKDEVFASFKKKKKAEAKDIPAATQIFTPNWIVKYMVENTAGKLWLDHKPNSPLKDQMKYLVTNENDIVSSSAERIENEPLINDVEQLTLIDPACGSGHILVEGFELLYQMYLEEYYTPEEAVQTIFEKNLYGLDIDDRAAQLATFAVLLKAAKVYPDVWGKDWQLNIYAMPEANSFSREEVVDFLGETGKDHVEELESALMLMEKAKNLGSVMQFDLSEEAMECIQERYQELQQDDYLDFNLKAILQKAKSVIPVLLTLTKKYTAVVANPPYMGQKSMNGQLKNYVNAHYPMTKSDLCTAFIEVLPNFTEEKGKYGFIVPPSWMFLTSYEKLRNHIVENQKIDSLLHLSRGVFGADFGSVSTVISNEPPKDSSKGTYLRLVERTFQEFYQGHLEQLFFKANGNVDFKYKFTDYSKENSQINHSDNGLRVYYPDFTQSNFAKIAGSPIAYWVSDSTINSFDRGCSFVSKNDVKSGLSTGDNLRFVRSWFELDFRLFCNHVTEELKVRELYRWLPYNKGGGVRKWYGNNILAVKWGENGNEIRNSGLGVFRNEDYYFKEGITWSGMSSSYVSFRFTPSGFIFDSNKGPMIFSKSNQTLLYLGLVNNSPINYFLKILNPTVSTQIGDISNIPLLEMSDSIIRDTSAISGNNVDISKKDWDSREISWDFEQSPLLNESNSLEKAYQTWKEDITQDFFQLHSNEEELNRIFIDIYGLQEELTPEVALKDITILQDELNGKDLEALEPKFRAKGANAISLPIDRAEVIQQFISYAIGLFMGRYRLDKSGLNIAHPNPTTEELASYDFNNGYVTIDEDAIVPLMGTAANFKDDALYQIQELLDTIWGHDTRTENLNFLQDALNKDLEKYLVKDFWKYHCKTYKKKPIYWLFSSKKGAFQVLVYIHRMNAFTVEKIRANYLLEHLKYLNAEIDALESNEANLTTQQARKLDQLRKDLLECEDYDMHLKNAADQQISFDLDDGVTENYKLFEGVVAKIK